MSGMSLAILLALLQVLPTLQKTPAAANLPCEQTIASKPHHIDALSLCAELYVKRGNYQRAIDILRQITPLAAWSTRNHYFAGFAFYKLHYWEAAQQQLEISISLSPNDPAAYVYLGDVYQQSGNTEAGLQMFEEYLKRFPHDLNRVAVEKIVKRLRSEK
jgi:tetratricopeptide (TPR) repeat protein